MPTNKKRNRSKSKRNRTRRMGLESLESRRLLTVATLVDGAGFQWDIQENGEITNGTNDAFDGGFVHDGFPDQTTHSTEDSGRTIVLGPDTVATGIDVTRKVFVSDQQGFARFLEIVQNTSSSTRNYTLTIDTDLGSDGATQLITTSDLDMILESTDSYVVTDDTGSPGDPAVAHIIQSTPDPTTEPTSFTQSGDDIQYSYDLTLAPGEAQIVMHFGVQNNNPSGPVGATGDAANIGSLIGNLPGTTTQTEYLKGLSSAEKSRIVNFQGFVDNDEPNDTKATATPLGVVLNSRTVQRRIHGTADTSDWYSFTAPTTGDASISLEFFHSQGDLDLIVEDANGVLIGLSQTITDNELIDPLAVVQGEVYFVRVFGIAGDWNPNYSMTITTPPIQPDVFEPNGGASLLPEDAADLGTLNSGSFQASDLTIHETGFSGLDFPIDSYRFVAAGTGSATAQITYDTSNPSLVLAVSELIGTNCDIPGNCTLGADLGESNMGSGTENVTFNVEVGKHYSIVVANPITGLHPDYDLSIVSPPLSADAFEPNDTLATAFGIGELGGLFADFVAIYPTIHESGDEDFFSVGSIGFGTMTVEATFDHSLGDVDLQVFANGQTLTSNSTTNTERITFDVEPSSSDTYGIRIFGFAGTTNPVIELTFTTDVIVPDVNESNEDVLEATDLGVLLNPTQQNDLNIHNNDDLDFFSFVSNFTGDATVDLSFIHADGDLSLEVITGQTVQTVDTLTDNETLTFPVVAGEINFIKIDGQANPNYSLNVTPPLPTVFTVNTTSDTADANPGDGVALDQFGNTSLRAAIEEANLIPGFTAVDFAIPGNGPFEIDLGSQLPDVTQPIQIDGFVNGAPSITIDGQGQVADGLRLIDHTRSIIAGLAFVEFTNDGLEINGGEGHALDQNRFGVDASGNSRGNQFGLKIINSSTNSITLSVISGNTSSGIFINGEGNAFGLNAVGLDPTGTFAMPNGGAGINVIRPNNQIIQNFVSGNDKMGILVSPSAENTTIQNNQVGLNVNGNALPNQSFGVQVLSANNTIGGAGEDEGNVLSGNGRHGLIISGEGADNNVVQGNIIGLDPTGTSPVPNGSYGVFIVRGDNNIIGGFGTGAENVISGNDRSGVVIATGADFNQITSNYIGTNESLADLGNGGSGIIVMAGSSNNGFTGNFVFGNDATGISIIGPSSTLNALSGNFVGGAPQLGITIDNGPFAVLVQSPNNLLDNNVILGNNKGIVINGLDANSNTIINNQIGVSIAPTSMKTGIQIGQNAAGSVIQNNVITQVETGVRLLGNAGNGNEIRFNQISNNSVIGIDLAGLGPTNNDLGDADEGGNRQMNHPVLLFAEDTGFNVDVTFDVPTDLANASYPLNVDFYKSDGTSQGQTFLKTVTFTAPALTIATISSALIEAGERITATATDSQGNTSEFAADIEVVDSAITSSAASSAGQRSSLDVNADGTVSSRDALAVINRLNQPEMEGELVEESTRRRLVGDTNGDNRVSSLDALRIINWLGKTANTAEDSIDLNVLGLEDRDEFTDEAVDAALSSLF